MDSVGNNLKAGPLFIIVVDVNVKKVIKLNPEKNEVISMYFFHLGQKWKKTCF